MVSVMRNMDRNVTKSMVEEGLFALFAIMAKSLKQGMDINIPELGKFTAYYVEPKMMRNPATNIVALANGRTKVKFKMSQRLSDYINNKK